MIVCFMLISFYAKALTVRTIVAGDWENSTTWNTNQVPVNPDTILILHYVSLNQNLIINAPTVLLIDAGGNICGDYLMETFCGASFLNYGHIYLNQIKTRSGVNYNLIQCKTSIILSGCPSGSGSFNSFPPNGNVEVWPPVFCKTPATNWEGSTTGLMEFEITTLKIYPNPVNNSILTITASGNTFFKLTDVMGKLIRSADFTNKTSINMDDLPNGIYFLEVQMDHKTQTNKILKIN